MLIKAFRMKGKVHMKTDPKSLKLSAKRLDWVIDVIRDNTTVWEYDRTINKYWIASDELDIQVEMDMRTSEYEVHTW
jgi:hypothetical protein